MERVEKRKWTNVGASRISFVQYQLIIRNYVTRGIPGRISGHLIKPDSRGRGK